MESLFQSTDSKIKYNITKVENETLHNLSKNSDVFIKPADKGGGLVLINTSDYVGEIRQQLSDGQFYKKLQFDPVKGVVDYFCIYLCIYL